jgi:biotin carboxyl carrier protein
LRAGETTTAFLVEHPPLSAPPAALPDQVWRGAFRLNLPSPAPQPPPDIDAATSAHGAGTGSATITAPMPGTVIKVNVHQGSTVEAGDPLVVLEAMKMETPLVAPFDAKVKAVHVEEGDRVAGGAVLVELDD